MDNFLRPQKVADTLGISLASFWRIAKAEPDFPQLIKLSPRCTVVRAAELSAYMDKKASSQRQEAVAA